MYGFGANEAQVEQARGLKESDGLVTVPSQGDVGFYLKTFLAEFASGILWEFSNMVSLRSFAFAYGPADRNLTRIVDIRPHSSNRERPYRLRKSRIPSRSNGQFLARRSTLTPCRIEPRLPTLALRSTASHS